VKEGCLLEIIIMTYSFIQNVINTEAFPRTEPILDHTLMDRRARGKYCYKAELRATTKTFLREQVAEKLKMPILNIV